MEQRWTDHLINAQTVQGLYEQAPPLEGFRLRELQLDHRGPALTLCGDLEAFPDRPRPSWDDEATDLELRLNLSAIENFEARGGAAGGHIDLAVHKEGPLGVVVEGRGEQFEFRVEGIALQVLGLRPHCGGEAIDA